MHKTQKRGFKNVPLLKTAVFFAFFGLIVFIILSIMSAALYMFIFEKRYENRVYPGVYMDGLSFGGKTQREVEKYWLLRNIPFETSTFEFVFENETATISGLALELGYDATLSAKQAFLVGRSNHFLSNVFTKFFVKNISLKPYFRWNMQKLNDTIKDLEHRINIPAQDALFRFENGRVTAFRTSKEGQKVNTQETIKVFAVSVDIYMENPQKRVRRIDIPVETVKPNVTTDKANTFGIKEKIGEGYSEFAGSIQGRIHNITLAASRLNGLLIKPGGIFSFNEALGDISAATGYQSAYIIKEGRTILGDGGGVCQVSSTFFRAALNAGLPIIERYPHSYRVAYYEQAGYKPGLDATVYAPSIDLKVKNDTPAYILIQSVVNTSSKSLTFSFYGTDDGRSAQIFNHQIWDVTPPPPPLYQDDPTLSPGTVKQVDWSAWGAKTSYQYKVTRGVEVLEDSIFRSNFQPWQAVYLRGPNLTN